MKELATLLLQCDICYEERDCSSDKTLACGHGFHTNCIQSWLLRSNSCPICRRSSWSFLPLDSEIALRCYVPINVAQVLRWPNSTKGLKAKILLLFTCGAAIVTARFVSDIDGNGLSLPPNYTRALIRGQKSAEYTGYYLHPNLQRSIGRVKKYSAFSPFDKKEEYIKPDSAIWRAAIETVLARLNAACEESRKSKYEYFIDAADGEYEVCSRSFTLGNPHSTDDGYSSYSRAYQD